MTFKPPAHKETRPEHVPGQIVNVPLGDKFQDKTLTDYIRRKNQQEALIAVANEKKLDMKTWWNRHCHNMYLKDMDWNAFEIIWKAAQENK